MALPRTSRSFASSSTITSNGPVTVSTLATFAPSYVNAAIADLPNQVPHTAYVSAEDTIHKGDEVHFDSASARTMGERYAAAMEGLIIP